jgi:DNA-binding transcriptional LysR family regulator
MIPVTIQDPIHRHPRRPHRHIPRASTPHRLILLIVINLELTFAVPNISIIGHLGGLVTGAIAGLGVAYAPRSSQIVVLSGITATSVVVTLAPFPSPHPPEVRLNSATMASTLNNRRPTGSVGSCTDPPRFSFTDRRSTRASTSEPRS